MFEIYPAIDLLGGRCVRLYQGDYDRATHYDDDPVARACEFAAAGAPWVHVVDLDAARTGEPVNRAVIGSIVRAIEVPVQTGGGVRSLDAAAALADMGVERVVVGTAALEDPALVGRIAERQRVAVGLDVRGREVVVRGWTEGSGRDLLDVAAGFEQAGVDALVVTQISRDGTLEGPDFLGLAEVVGACPIPVVASGGVGSIDDVTMLASLDVAGRRLAGVIVGRAIYEGRVGVADMVAVARSPNGGRR